MAEFFRKIFTRYDETDSLKGMKDADILAQEKRQNKGGFGRSLSSGFQKAIKGVGVGAATGMALGALTGGKGRRMAGMARGLKVGAALGGAYGFGRGYINQHSQESKINQDNRFYNDRLEYAQRRAARRERKDWINNTNNREGYSY